MNELILLPYWIKCPISYYYYYHHHYCIPLLYHIDHTTKLQMICNNYSLFFLLFPVVSASDERKKFSWKRPHEKTQQKRVTLLMKNIPEMSKKLLFFFCHSAVSGKCPTNSSLSHAPLSPLSVFQDLLLKLQNFGSCFCSPYYQVIIRISSAWDNAIKFGKGKKAQKYTS